MESKKFVITDKLRLDIIHRRKEMDISASALSEKSGHSKFWLANIENEKTKKITTEDLLSIYRILIEDYVDDEEEILDYIEAILNQPLSDRPKSWYELISVNKQYAEANDPVFNQIELNKLLKEIKEDLSLTIWNLPVYQQQAALTALHTFHYSVYYNPELALALANIPIYGVDIMNQAESTNALAELLALAAKYNDLAQKNDSINTILKYKDLDKQIEAENRETIHSVLNSYISMLSVILDYKDIKNPKLHNVRNQFYASVILPIERVRKGTLGGELSWEWEIKTGKDFSNLIEKCFEWFEDYEEEYGLPDPDKAVPNQPYHDARNFLETVDKIEQF